MEQWKKEREGASDAARKRKEGAEKETGAKENKHTRWLGEKNQEKLSLGLL